MTDHTIADLVAGVVGGVVSDPRRQAHHGVDVALDRAERAATDARDRMPAAVPHPADVVAWHERGWGTQPITPFTWASGAAFVLDAPEAIPAVWGEGDTIAWSQGEPLVLYGQVGTGKSTLAQQLALARIGVRPARLLDLPVAPSAGRVLYLACDRPQQIRRSLRRMVTPADRDLLEARLVPWSGPLPFNLATEPDRLLGMVQAAGRHEPDRGPVDTVVIDSLKDIALDLVSDETGSRVALAMQQLLAAGVEVVVLHHARKAAAGDKTKLRSVDDLYGSRWISAAAGSILHLNGHPGDAYIRLEHLKQPAESIGPLKVMHDHTTGTTTVAEHIDLVVLAGQRGGITAADAARVLADNDSPDRNAIERARRRLDTLTNRGLLARREGVKGGSEGGTPTTWHPSTSRPPTAPHPAVDASPELPL